MHEEISVEFALHRQHEKIFPHRMTSSAPDSLFAVRSQSLPTKAFCQSWKNKTFKEGRWTKQEHEAFLKGIEQYGRDWRRVSRVIGTRNSVQARSHAQKYFKKMEKKVRQLEMNLCSCKKNHMRVAKRKKCPRNQSSNVVHFQRRGAMHFRTRVHERKPKLNHGKRRTQKANKS